MSKPAPPIRISRELYDAAELAGQVEQRSGAKQVEYWARIGRLAAKTLSGNDLLAISSGVAEAKARYQSAGEPDPDQVFDALERDRASSQLRDRLKTNGTRYQASTSCPGLLEQIDNEGRCTPGRFINGQFIPEPAEPGLQSSLGK